jgi:hypothetical protein
MAECGFIVPASTPRQPKGATLAESNFSVCEEITVQQAIDRAAKGDLKPDQRVLVPLDNSQKVIGVTRIKQQRLVVRDGSVHWV